MYVSDIDHVIINSSRFVKNQATSGGAVYAEMVKSLIQVDALFVSNFAHANGGALFTRQITHVNCKNVLFRENKATKSGGALSLEMVHYTRMEHVYINNNMAVLNGGGVRIKNCFSFSILASSILNNRNHYWLIAHPGEFRMRIL